LHLQNFVKILDKSEITCYNQHSRFFQPSDNSEFKWTSGSVPTFDMWVMNASGVQVSGKKNFPAAWENDGQFHRLSYMSGFAIATGTKVTLRVEQSTLGSKTLNGIARIF
jgi:hypothetical protein